METQFSDASLCVICSSDVEGNVTLRKLMIFTLCEHTFERT